MQFPVYGNAKHLIGSLAVLLFSLSLVHPAAGGTLPSRAETTKSCGTANNSTKPGPKHFGILLPRAFSVLDVFGPLEIFQALSRQTTLELSLLSRTLDPAKTEPFSATMNKFNSSFFPTVVPTHTYDDDPPIDALIIPGGMASRSPDLGPEIEYIRKVFPRLEYLITICTGAGIAAQAGVLDGHRATTNKAAWATMTAMGTNVKWVSPARWVDDGKVWSSSGVTAGLDLAFAFIKAKYPNGTDIAEFVAGNMEHTIITDWRDDPWAAHFGVPPQN